MKILRRYFLYDRKLLSDLSRCGWEALKRYLKKAAKGKKAVPGAVIAIQTFGDFLGFNPHLDIYRGQVFILDRKLDIKITKIEKRLNFLRMKT